MDQKSIKTAAGLGHRKVLALKLTLLGSHEVILDNRPLSGIGSQKTRALLFYLAMTARPSSRDTLAALLWSEMAEEPAKNNLRTTLANLKRHIGPYLDATPTSVAFNRRLPYMLDVEIVRTRLDAALSAPEPKELEAAIELYQGEFLQGFHVRNAEPFEEWMLQQREQLHLLTLQAVETLTNLCIERSEYSIGLTAGRRWLAMEPWSETAHRQTMILLAASGQRTQALQQYKTCCRVLADELSIEPSAETNALFQQIQAETYKKGSAPKQPELPAHPSSLPPLVELATIEQPSVPHNLPTPLAAFIERQTELDILSQKLYTPNCRLLTVVGPGGIGKTSLALEVGQRLLYAKCIDYPDGIFFVPLADIKASDGDRFEERIEDSASSGEAILRAIAEQLGDQLKISLSSTVQLQAYLHTRRLLLILDNFEHLLAGIDALVTLLTKAPQIKALITSRVRLNVRGENILTLDKLSLPAASYDSVLKAIQANPAYIIEDKVWQESEAVTMFLQRAQQFDPDFTINVKTIGPVAEICQQVEGLPLGIELATSMLPLLSCGELAVQLAEDLDFLAADTRDLPHDQRTLAAVFERSWRLLLPAEQQLLARLAIFPASFRRDAAEEIAGASIFTLKRLIDQSLVSKVGEDRYILHRTIQTFAQRKLQQWPEQIATLHVQYARFYLEFLAYQEKGITGAAYTTATEQIRADLDNIHTAWHRAVTHQMYSELHHCLATLFFFYEQHGFNLNVFALHEYALSHLEPSDERERNSTKSDPARLLLIGLLKAYFAWYNLRIGRLQQVRTIYESSWSILEQTDSFGEAAICLGFWGAWEKVINLQQSTALLTESLRLAQISGLKWLEAVIHLVLGENSFLSGQYDKAKARINAGSKLARQMQWSRTLTSGHKILARVDLLCGHYRQAEEGLREAIALARQYHFDIFYVECTLMLGEALRLQG